jgi:hypothetical protein
VNSFLRRSSTEAVEIGKCFSMHSSMQCLFFQEGMAKTTVIEEAGLLGYGCVIGWFGFW